MNKQNYSFTNMLADLGGIQSILFLICGLIFPFLSKQLLMKKILKRLFLVKERIFGDLKRPNESKKLN